MWNRKIDLFWKPKTEIKFASHNSSTEFSFTNINYLSFARVCHKHTRTLCPCWLCQPRQIGCRCTNGSWMRQNAVFRQAQSSRRYSHVPAVHVWVSMGKVSSHIANTTKPIFDTHGTQADRETHTIVKTSNNEICHCKSVHIYYFAIKDIHSCVRSYVLSCGGYRETSNGRPFSFDSKVFDSTIKLQFRTPFGSIHSTQIFPVLSFAVRMKKRYTDHESALPFSRTSSYNETFR